MDWRSLESFTFGDSPAVADALCDLVLAGVKTASCWPASKGPLTEIGKRMVAKDGAGRARCVVETTELFQRRFDEVDAAFAYDEGEDDRTLAAWRRGHEDCFARNGGFSPDMMLWCERFKLVHVIEDAT